VRFLLDTHFLIWIPTDNRRLNAAARRLLLDPENDFVFSAASLWEIALKRSRQGADFAFEPRALRTQFLANGYLELAVEGAHAVAVDSLPPIHKDPFDRLLIAQAVVEGITLLTVDKWIARYPGPIRKV
jgi:PIN domain nuclease of toxin-antitoxin system